ncbi:hypothetical protein HD554DRAFT_1026886 [Boletus coccyginus]|nr:hypothetical protein HD554DRAFT_1026886 [Boletus coccyginus]
MVHWWQDPAREAQLAVVYVNVSWLLFGIYIWEYFLTLRVEYAVIRGRLPVRWPLVPYLVGRISLLISRALIVIELSASSESFACQPVIAAIAITADIAIGTTSINLMIRTWVIWKNSRFVHLLLLLLALGHWTILVTGTATVKISWLNGVCVTHFTQPGVTAGVYVYTVCYDLLVLVLSVVKLSYQPSKSPLKEHLRAQGILYFTVAAIANIPPMVFAFLDSDGMIALFLVASIIQRMTVMVNITGTFAIAVSTIVSCRAVRSLFDLRTPRQSHMLDENGEDLQVLTTRLSNQPSTISMGGV